MEIKRVVTATDYECGIIIGRFQVDSLHESHHELIRDVCNNHRKVIIFLGVTAGVSNKSNPMDFATRKLMIQMDYPNVVILPLKNNRSDVKWSNDIDNQIGNVFGSKTALLYGSRDSFIPSYSGKHKTVELITDTTFNGTIIRKNISREILGSADFRRGIIHSVYSDFPKTYPTVDIACFNNEGKLLLARKPNETKLRFIGGFVDPSDISYEKAAVREFMEETGSCEPGDMEYVGSVKVNDWRYNGSENGIMTTLFKTKLCFGNPVATDDIESVTWVDISKFTDTKSYSNIIVEEHLDLMNLLITKIRK